jgi:alkanesulfonate monooxygenase SsuD/methylene tetrahydromethanopterin reductase-like flavin-dependent oxidoreductase (luciferase family)
VILAFLVIVLSIQTKLGLKVNILVDRLGELWNGPEKPKKRVAASSYSIHSNSQADYLDSVQMQGPDVFPPAPVAVQKPMQIQASPSPTMNDFAGAYSGPVAANTILGGSFGSLF